MDKYILKRVAAISGGDKIETNVRDKTNLAHLRYQMYHKKKDVFRIVSWVTYGVTDHSTRSP